MGSMWAVFMTKPSTKIIDEMTKNTFSSKKQLSGPFFEFQVHGAIHLSLPLVRADGDRSVGPISSKMVS